MTDTLNNPLSLAYERGRKAAEAAATHTEIPEPPHNVTHLIAMLMSGSPEAEPHLPSRPDLSAEWGGSETISSLVRAVTGAGAICSDEEDDICEAWERGVSDHFANACIAELRRRSERRVAS